MSGPRRHTHTGICAQTCTHTGAGTHRFAHIQRSPCTRMRGCMQPRCKSASEHRRVPHACHARKSPSSSSAVSRTSRTEESCLQLRRVTHVTHGKSPASSSEEPRTSHHTCTEQVCAPMHEQAQKGEWRRGRGAGLFGAGDPGQQRGVAGGTAGGVPPGLPQGRRPAGGAPGSRPAVLRQRVVCVCRPPLLRPHPPPSRPLDPPPGALPPFYGISRCSASSSTCTHATFPPSGSFPRCAPAINWNSRALGPPSAHTPPSRPLDPPPVAQSPSSGISGLLILSPEDMAFLC